MRNWDERSEEIRYLLNPAFCGRLIYHVVNEYQRWENHGLPFPLVFLILPLILPNQIRSSIDSRTRLANWVKAHQNLVYNFGKRAGDMVEITSEAIEFMMQTGYLQLAENGMLSINTSRRRLRKTSFIDQEVSECIQKAEHVGRWFSSAGKAETVFICLGVRP